MIERRRFPRISVKFPREYRGKRIWQVKRVLNISRGGMFIVTENIEPPGTEIELIFDFGEEDTRTVMAKAAVVWNRKTEQRSQEDDRVLPPGMGIQFIDTFPADIERFLRESITE